MITHDLRSPLTSIYMFFDLIEEGVFGPVSTAITERVSTLKRAIERLTGLITELLNQEKIETVEFVSRDRFDTDLGIVLKESIEMVQYLAVEKQVEIVCDYPEVVVQADETRLVQVFQNLISNAIKYSPRGARIVISVSVSNESVTVSVRDQGPGIDPLQHEKIFERYQQVADKEGIYLSGTGLGLWVCREIIRQHHGTVTVESSLGNGTTFVITMPLRKRSS